MFYRDIDDLAIKDKLKLKIKDRLYEYKSGKVSELPLRIWQPLRFFFLFPQLFSRYVGMLFFKFLKKNIKIWIRNRYKLWQKCFYPKLQNFSIPCSINRSWHTLEFKCKP